MGKSPMTPEKILMIERKRKFKIQMQEEIEMQEKVEEDDLKTVKLQNQNIMHIVQEENLSADQS